MATTRTSVFFIPGKRAGNINRIVNNQCENATSACQNQNINSKIVKNSNSDVIPLSTQVERTVSAIRYSNGGRVTYGNIINGIQVKSITFLGRTEGQSGGIIGPLRNKF